MNIYYDPKNYGVVGQGDDTAAIQGAVNAIRTAGGGVLLLEQPYTFGGINARNCDNIEVLSHHCCIHHVLPLPVAGVNWDAMGSHNISFEKFNLVGPQQIDPHPTSACLLFGGTSAGAGVDKITLDRVWINGNFVSAAIAVVGATSLSLRDAQLVQWNSGSPTLIMSTCADWSITSQFGSINPPTGNFPIVGDIYFDGYTETHQLNHGAWTVYIRNGDHIRLGGLSSNSNTGHILMQGTCSHITDNARKYYAGDNGTQQAQKVYDAGSGSSVVGLVSVNPCRDGIQTLFGGNTPSYQYNAAIPSQT